MINRSIKITSFPLVADLQKSNVTAVRFFRKDGYFYAVRREGDTLGSDLLPYKKQLIQIRTPETMKHLRGCDYRVSKQMIDPNPDELFRIIVDRKVPDEIDFPVFRARQLMIPESYANAYLDERYEVLWASFSLAADDMIEKGRLEVFLSERHEPLSFKVNRSRNNLAVSNFKVVRERAENLNKDIRDFKYVDTVKSDGYYKYGVMVFEEENNNGNNI